MDLQELAADASCVKAIQNFVNSKEYLAIKDSFIAHTPGGDTQGANVDVAHGKFLGTRYVFNTMERLAKPKKPPEQPTRRRGPDPDLASE